MKIARLLTAGGAGLLATAAVSTSTHAQSADALIDKLVEKGVLSNKEAEELREEADKNFTTSYQVKSGMPDWVEALKFNGDFRGRFEGFYSDATYTQNNVTSEFVDRTRWRYRLRFGATAVLKNNFEIGLRLGSGDLDSYPGSGIDPISNNQSLQNNASKKGIFIDLAYAKWAPINTSTMNAAFTFGKMENPFVFSDMIIDHDYTPEGAAIQTTFFASETQHLKFNGGAFILDELGGSSNDPYMFAGQLRLDSTWSKKVSTSLGAAWIGIQNTSSLANNAVPNISRGNNRIGATDATAVPAYDFYPIVGDASLTYTLESFPMYAGPFPIKVGGDYAYNPGAPSSADNYAYSAGILFGKSGKKGTWDVSYTWKWLGANFWWEELPDSDTGAFWGPAPGAANPGSPYNNSGFGNPIGYFAGTNVRGHVAKVSYSPFDSLTLSVKGFITELIDVSPTNGESEMTRVQVDAMLKF